MKITGELLKSERIKKDLSVQDIGYALKLNSRIITAIENGELDQLPAKTFVRGFVKSYADYLKMDSDIVLKQFQEEMGSTRPLPRRPPPIATDQVTAKKIEHKSTEKITLETKFNKNHIMAFAIVFILILLISFINNKIKDYKNESLSSLNKISYPTENQSTTPLPSATISTTETATSETNAAVDNEPKEVPGDESTLAKTPIAPVEDSQPISPPAPSLSATPPVYVSYPIAPTSSGKPVELLIEAKKEITVEYAKGNSTKYTAIRLQPQTFQIIRSQVGLHLRTPDGSALTITVNGVLKGTAAPKATPTVLSY
jgi:cytoskeleton protein RodZ